MESSSKHIQLIIGCDEDDKDGKYDKNITYCSFKNKNRILWIVNCPYRIEVTLGNEFKVELNAVMPKNNYINVDNLLIDDNEIDFSQFVVVKDKYYDQYADEEEIEEEEEEEEDAEESDKRHKRVNDQNVLMIQVTKEMKEIRFMELRSYPTVYVKNFHHDTFKLYFENCGSGKVVVANSEVGKVEFNSVNFYLYTKHCTIGNLIYSSLDKCLVVGSGSKFTGDCKINCANGWVGLKNCDFSGNNITINLDTAGLTVTNCIGGNLNIYSIEGEIIFQDYTGNSPLNIVSVAGQVILRKCSSTSVIKITTVSGEVSFKDCDVNESFVVETIEGVLKLVTGNQPSFKSLKHSD